MKITKDTTLEEVLKLKDSEAVLSKHNFPCLSCPMHQMEMASLKLGDVCNTYNIDLERLLADLNKLKN